MFGNREPGRLIVLARIIYHALAELRWSVLAVCVVLHMLLSWFLLLIAGEQELLPWPSFIYWYATTASTVGYGDLSPVTDEGRLFTAAIVFPGAIAAFTSIIAKAAAGLSGLWRRRRLGFGDFSMNKKSIVLVGYDEERTPRMINELCADAEQGQELVLLARREFENDDPRISYVRARSLTASADLERAGIANAARIIVFAANDEETLAAALAVTAMNRSGHIVAFFEEEENARLLTAHCPTVEVVLTPSVELVVKALKDPGSSQLFQVLASHTQSAATLFSMDWAKGETPFRQASSEIMEGGGILISVRDQGSDGAPIHFDVNSTINRGDRIFYIAPRRLTV